MSRETTIEALRALADYLEERPDVPMPSFDIFNAFATPEELPLIARAMGGFTKDHDGDYLMLVKDFGGVQLHVNFNSEQVCERVVVGTEEVPEKVVPAHTKEIVEWKCPESVLALADTREGAA